MEEAQIEPKLTQRLIEGIIKDINSHSENEDERDAYSLEKYGFKPRTPITPQYNADGSVRREYWVNDLLNAAKVVEAQGQL